MDEGPVKPTEAGQEPAEERFAALNRQIAQLEHQVAGLREQDRRKDEFLAALAHELRNPLAALSAASHLLARNDSRPEVVAMARDALHRQVAHMSHLLDGFLDVARVRHGRMVLRKERLPVVEPIREAIEAARPLIEERNHQVAVEIPDDAQFVEADPVRLTQVFSNLLTNACKYTETGGQIRVQLRVADRHVAVAVSDNGIGIDRDALPGIFDMFAQGKAAATQSDGGLGIGLALVHGLVNLHGGTVTAESAGPGRGSTFTVRLPLSPAAAAVVAATPATRDESEAAAPIAAPSRRILVADDNADSANTWAALLGISGHIVKVAYNGRQAVDLAQAFEPEVALLDVGMPEINGYEVARRIRQTAWGKNILLVAVSGWGLENDKQQARNAGFDHHLTKPVKPGAIEQLLADGDSSRRTLPAD